jgi:hypothetical protein
MFSLCMPNTGTGLSLMTSISDSSFAELFKSVHSPDAANDLVQHAALMSIVQLY